jgi:hypothetical protein
VAARSRVSTEHLLQRLAHDYMQKHGLAVIDLDPVAEWMVKHGYFKRNPPTLVQVCKRELARALRNEYIRDPQGREVRRMHPARFPRNDGSGRQMVLWADIFQARPNHMRVSMQQRRNGILADARQHKTDLDSYNANNVHDARLPLFDYNFNKDLEELALPTTYPDRKPDDEDDDSEN